MSAPLAQRARQVRHHGIDRDDQVKTCNGSRRIENGAVSAFRLGD
jgi:hypothetical protein